MEEANGGISTEGGDAHWSDTHETITNNVDVHNYAKKYGSEGELAKAGHELEKKLGSGFRLPDDLKSLTAEQQAELHSRIKTLRNVPEKPEGYEIKKAELPEGLPYDEGLEVAFRHFAHERGWDTKDVQELYDFYNNALTGSFEKIEEAKRSAAASAERDFRIRCGADYDKKMEDIKKLRIMATDELGLGYTNDKGELASKLDDCLDETQLGNKTPILQMLAWIHEKFLAEGQPIPSAGVEAGAGGDFFKYENVDK